MKQKIDFIKLTQKMGVVFLVSLAAILITYETIVSYIDYDYRANRRRNEFIAEKKECLKQEVMQVVEIINLKLKNPDYDEEKIKEELFELIGNIRFGKEGYIFINKFNGDALISNGQVLSGKQKLWEVYTTNSEKMKDIFDKEYIAAQKHNGDFINYTFRKYTSAVEESPKVSFIYGIQKLQWLVGAGVYLTEINSDLALMKNQIITMILKNLIYTIVVVIITIAIFLFLINLQVKKLKNDFGEFNLFLTKAACNNEPINLSKIKFSNFEEMAINANNMLVAKMIAEKELFDEKEQLFVTIRSVGDGLITTDKFGKVQLMNSVAEKLTGWKNDEAKGLELAEIFEIVNESTREKVVNPVNLVLLEHKIVGLANHTVLIAKDGTEYNIADSAAPILDEQKNIRGVVLVFRDVTAEYQMQKSLAKSEERYARLSSLTYEGIVIHNGGLVIDANKAIEEISGYCREELLGKNVIQMVIPQKYHEVVIKNMKSDFVLPYEVEVIRKDGTILPIEIESRKIEFDGEKKNIRLAAIRDISKRKESEWEIRKLSNAITQNTISVVITDKNGKFEYVNPKFTEITGYSLNELTSKTPNILKSGEHPKEYYSELWQTILGGNKWTGELHNRKKSGELFWESVTISPIKNNSGEIINFVAVKEDITEKKKMIDEVIKAKNNAENANKMKSIFLAQMSHEIRTPINALVSMASLLRYDFEENATEEQIMSFDIIDRAGDRIIRTVDLLLNLSEIQAGTYEKNISRFDLYAEILISIVAENKKLAEKKNLKFTLINSASDTEIIGDSYTVNQIFIQLIDNALKYTFEGEVSIKMIRNDDENLAVEVEDTGIGIEDEYLTSLFEPFSQEEMGFTRKFEGNGIGMALVKKYCELNNAQIEVFSKKDVGSKFRVTFS
ncbi:MAG: PAS domain S-box protein [Bacteroidetes bacterium]|nr:PAS domain S-box protein [Bacteroidota bacterium]MBU1116968.1 PAS domain S-box protein [Bacteroidota bacterium]MBU1799035.1 PAS domain S-box protein [Bacteroidota bacterium]